MKVTAKAEYGCVAMLELAANYESEAPVAIREIGEKHGVPPRFLVQILAMFKDAGLVESTRGAAGGYRLGVAPNKITLGQVMDIVQEREDDQLYCCSSPNSPLVQSLFSAWTTANNILQEYLNNITLADLIEE